MKLIRFGFSVLLLSAITSAQVISTPGFSPAPSTTSPIALDRSQPLDPNLPRLPRAQAPELLDPESWQAWWRYNGPRLIDLESAIYSERAADRSDLFSVGRNERRSVQDGRPSVELIDEHVVPALMAVLSEENDKDLVAGALIALGRAGAKTDLVASELVAFVLPFVGSGNAEIAESAIVALGWLGAPAADELAALLHDRAAGQRLAGGRVSERERAFAAYALGLIGARAQDPAVCDFVVGTLGLVLERKRERARSVRLASVSALGSVRLTPESADHQIDRLLSWGAFEADPFVAGGVLLSLAKLTPGASEDARASVGEALLEGFAERGEVSRAAAAAAAHVDLSNLHSLESNLFSGLAATAFEHPDSLTRRLALMSLVERPTRFAHGDRDTIVERARRVVERFAQTEESSQRGWSALASGVLEHRVTALGGMASAESVERLRERWTEARNVDEREALALALGLVGDVTSAARLIETLDDSSDDRSRRHLALALGWIDTRVLGPLRTLLTESTHRPDLLEAAAMSLVLQRDPEVVPYLTATLRSGPVFARASLARALGRVGDDRAVAPLVELARDDDAASLARAAAVTALGQVADVLPSPIENELAPGGPWWAAPAVFTDPATGSGFVDLL